MSSIIGFARVNDEELKRKIRGKHPPHGVKHVNADASEFVFALPFEADTEVKARRDAIHYWMQMGASVLELYPQEGD